MKQVLLAGNAITADILYAYLQHDARYEVVGLTVDDDYVGSEGIGGVQCVGTSQVKGAFSPDDVTIIIELQHNFGEL